MDDKSYLAYVNAKAYCFNHADFNFDARYIFEMELDDTEFLAKYILHVSKRKGLTQTDGFWGDNINSVSIVCGQNGAGKTSFFRLMVNNIGSGLTAMNGEFICYIVYHSGVYIVFTNTTRLEIEQSAAGDIVILTEKEYYKTLRKHNSYKSPFDNRRFWKNIIFFSNHFGTMGIRDDDYIINVSKDVEIGKVINNIETIDKLKKVSLQSIYKYNQNLKLFRYSNDEAFKMMASNCKVSLPNLLKFTINANAYYDAFLDDEKFPNKKWIGKPRYDIYTYADRDYEYEAAINRFSAYLTIDLLKRKLISEGVFQNFSDVLSNSPDKIGLEIALEILNECSNAQIEIWKQCLTFILNKSKNESERFVLNWQLEDEFCCTIERISVYPQCFAAVASQINDLPPKVLVVDIGSYLIDDTVYEIGLEYFTQYDESGKVIKEGKKYDVIEVPEPVGVLVQKTDSTSGNVVKGAGFAVFKDAACTQRVLTDGDSGTEIPVFYYDEDLDGAASEKFAKQQDVYYVKEVVVPDGYRDDGKVWEVKPDYGSFEEIEVTNTPIRCDVSVEKKDKETGNAQGDAALSGATYGLYAMETVNYPDGRGVVSYAGDDNITSTAGTSFYSTGTPANAGTLLATVQTDDSGNFNFGNLYYGKYYIQEIEPSEGYLLDDTKYEVDYTKEQNTHQDISVTRRVVETVKKSHDRAGRWKTAESNDGF